MPLPGDMVSGPALDELLRRIADLERDMTELRAAGSASAATVGPPGLTAKGGYIQAVDAAGQQRFYVGRIAYGGGDQQVFLVRDEASRVRLGLYDPSLGDGFQPVVWIFDHLGHVALTTDVNGGLAEPHVPVVLYQQFKDSTSVDVAGGYPTLPVSGCTGAVAWEGRISKVSHPRLMLGGFFGRSTGTTGVPTYTLKVNGTTVDTWSYAAPTVEDRGPYDISTLIGTRNVTVQLSITATGTATDRLLCAVLACAQRQT